MIWNGHSAAQHKNVKDDRCMTWQQKCSQESLVSGNIRSMWISAGVCLWKGIKQRLSVHLVKKRQNYYTVIYSPSMTFHWPQNRPPYMTPNDHFLLNSVFALQLFAWFSSTAARKQSKVCVYCRRQKSSPGTLVSGDISLWGYSRGFSGDRRLARSTAVIQFCNLYCTGWYSYCKLHIYIQYPEMTYLVLDTVPENDKVIMDTVVISSWIY